MENRIIKFRAWDATRTRLLPWEQVTYGQLWDTTYLHPSANVTLEQFTGLLDKNGKDEYENDIIVAGGKVFLVTWDKEAAAFRYVDSAGNSESPLNYDDPEVIGNIHENPDLLK